ncbi:MAG: hypothetical protein IH849_06730 [Acidobacteria bacterium]|nr:hypothetical protein [Acidobacteriota bacterium]
MVAIGTLQEAASAVPLAVTLLFFGLLVLLVTLLALEEQLRAKKSVIAGVFAIGCLLLGEALEILPPGTVTIGGESIDLPVYIPAIDWNVLAIIMGSSLFVDIISKSGLFTWIAIVLTKKSRGDPVALLVYYGVMTVVFSAVLNNVTAMIIVGSLTVVSLKRLGRDDLLLGFLLIEGFLTNVGGLLTLISSVPNIIVGTAADISFLTFFLKAGPYVLVAMIASLWLGGRLFGIERLTTDEERDTARNLVDGFDENDSIESSWAFWLGAVMLVLFIVAIATASVTPYIRELGMGYVAMGFGIIMLVRYKSVADKFYQAIDWDLLGFFAGLFVVLNVMEHAAVLELAGGGLARIVALGETVGSALLLVTAALASSVTDNIPIAAMLAKILSGHPEIGGDPASPFWWAVIFGANLGGNLTPIGSASTLVAITIIHKHGLAISFGGFVKKALPFAALQIVLATVYMLAVLR